ncbi:MAG: ribosome small subunit-dependent GTPase A [Gaiellales bacterium]
MEAALVPGLVLAVGGGLAAVRTEVGEERVAKFAGRLDRRPVAGDRVGLLLEPDGGARIDVIEERRTELRRQQRMRSEGERAMKEQVLAANAACVLIVASIADPPLRRGLIDRILVAGWRGGMTPLLAITKRDLADRALEPPEQVLADYAAIGVDGVAVDVRAPDGARAVRDLLAGRSAAVVGHSGVGKSTLVNALTGGGQATGAVHELSGRGRHTTTTATWLDVPGGGALIDLPGIRSFSLAGIEPGDLRHAFADVADAAERCRFRDCRHVGEDGCAVEAEVESARLASYRKLLAELEEG